MYLKINSWSGIEELLPSLRGSGFTVAVVPSETHESRKRSIITIIEWLTLMANSCDEICSLIGIDYFMSARLTRIFRASGYVGRDESQPLHNLFVGSLIILLLVAGLLYSVRMYLTYSWNN